jgi:hypothetical protein
MIKKLLASVVLSLAIVALFAFLGMPSTGCSPEELAAFATNHPSKLTSATTQAIEKTEEKLDTGADKSKKLVDTTKDVANGAATIGIPYAGGVAVILSGISGLLGTYIQRRRGTLPVKTALTQVVQSVESAFPQKTPEQKAALAAVQDSATKNLVTQIKGT